MKIEMLKDDVQEDDKDNLHILKSLTTLNCNNLLYSFNIVIDKIVIQNTIKYVLVRLKE